MLKLLYTLHDIYSGQGIFGVMISGCPETFESSQQSGAEQEQQEQGRQRFLDRHQKIEQFRQGDILAIPAGAAHWAYNNGDEEFVVVVLQDTTNNANQLDSNPRVQQRQFVYICHLWFHQTS